ncbi:NAD(P)/FAD-dependent oxidoreductase [Oryzifoliimicrobium ureilyticus]|uniref:NAD(P)/FAD-dependent oxidoreductase n=1 Tax=Oryzifoliimicrobium ureilyticus TaxID=3113724 RepID=UPI0030761CFC
MHQEHPIEISKQRAKEHVRRLAQLEKQVKNDLECIEAAPRDWVPERRDGSGMIITDVVIVGAGLSGLSLAFGLRRQGIHRIRLIDAAPAGREGPWLTTARMRTLRSPKTLSGPDLGVPSLTYRAWHDAIYGEASWEALDKIERTDWVDYLAWFRLILGLPVENGVRLLSISQEQDYLRLSVERDGKPADLTCRKVVLATGLEGAGGLNIPRLIKTTLPRERWTHSGEAIDVSSLAAKRIGVVGSAASSFDWAVAALEAEAESVTVLARSQTLARTEVLDWSNFPGFLNHFADLDDISRYRFTRRMFAFKTPPTNEMFNRATAFQNCLLVTGAQIRSIAMEGNQVRIGTTAGDFFFDHLLLGTGYCVDLAQRPELAAHIDKIATWADRFTPPAGEEDNILLTYPYLGSAFELQEKIVGTLPMLANIHLFNSAAVPSLGPICNGITGLKSGIPKLVSGISRGLFAHDVEHFYQLLDSFDKLHFQPDGIGI